MQDNNPKLIIEEEIGSGTYGKIFRGKQNSRTVAIKLYQHYKNDERVMEKLSREAASLSRMDHPTFVKVHDYGAYQDQPYLTMDYVDGDNLKKWIQKQKVSENFARRIAVCVASGLQHMHEFGLIHNDLKPDNIMITKTGEIRIIDFGLVTAHSIADSARAGSILYGSPEGLGLIKSNPDERSDLYSLGLILYEIISGTHPYATQSEGIDDFLRDNMLQDAPKLSSVAKPMSPEFFAAIDKLIKKDPDDRFQTAAEFVTHILDSSSSEEVYKFRSDGIVRDERHYLKSGNGEIFERQHQIVALSESWKKVIEAKEREFINISGAPGSGKTSVLNAFLDRYNLGSFRIEIDFKRTSGKPFDAIKFGLSKFIMSLKTSTANHEYFAKQLGEWLAGYEGVIIDFCPVVGHYVDVPNVVESTEAVDLVAKSIPIFISRICDSQEKMVIVLENIDNIDNESLTLIQNLMASTRKKPILVLSTSEKASQNSGKIPEVLLKHIDKNLDIPPLSADALAKVIKKQLTTEELPDSFLAEAHSRSQGNPFLVKEFVEEAISKRCLRSSWGEWIFSPELLIHLSSSLDVSELLFRRVEELDEDKRSILAKLSVFGISFSDRHLELFELEQGRISEVLGEFRDLKLILLTSEGGSYNFYNDQLVEHLQNLLNARQKREYSYKMAKAMRASEYFSSNHEVTIARLFLEAGNDPMEIVSSAILAANYSIKKKYFHEAYEVLDGIKKFISEKSENEIQGEYYRKLGEVAFNINKLEAAKVNLLKSLSYIHDKVSRATVFKILAQVNLAAFDFTGSYSNARQGLGELGAGLSKNKLLLYLDCFVCFLKDKLAKPLPFSDNPSQKAELIGELHILATHAVSYQLDYITALVLQFRNRYFANRSESRRATATHLAILSGLYALLRLPKWSRRNFEASVQLARTQDDPVLLSECLFWETLAELWSGDIKTCLKRGKLFIESYKGWLTYTIFHDQVMVQNIIGVGQGYVYQSHLWADLGIELEESTNRGQNPLTPMIYRRKAIAAAAEGDFQIADKFFAKAEELTPSEMTYSAEFAELLGRMAFWYYRNPHNEQIDLIVNHWEKDLKMATNQYMGLMNFFYVFYAHTLIKRLLVSEATAASQGAKLDLKKNQNFKNFIVALKKIRKAAPSERPIGCEVLVYAHRQIVEAYFQYFSGNIKRCMHFVSKAEIAAAEYDCPWVEGLAHSLKASLWEQKKNHDSARREAVSAFARYKEVGAYLECDEIRKSYDVSADLRTSSTLTSDTTMIGGSNLVLKRQLAAMIDVGLAISKTRNFEDLTHVIVREVAKVMNAERTILILKGKDGGMEFAATYGSTAKILKEEKSFSESIIRKCMNIKTPLIHTGKLDEKSYLSDSIEFNEIRSLLVVPLVLDDDCLGAIYVDNRGVKDLFGDAEVQLLSAICTNIVLIIESMRSASLENEKKALGLENEAIKIISAKMRNILENIKQGIFTFGTDMKINSEISDYSSVIFDSPKSNIVNRNIVEFLKNKTELSAEQTSMLNEALYAAVGEDEINWIVNEDHLVKEAQIGTDSSSKFLVFDWGRILDEDNTVSQIILSIRDITAQRRLEIDMASQKAEHDYVMEVISKTVLNDKSALSSFLERSVDVLDSMDKEGVTADQFATIMRDLHTIKGESRIFKLNNISGITHETERVLLAKSKENLGAMDIGSELVELTEELGKFKSVFDRYFGSAGSLPNSLHDYASQILPHALEMARSNGHKLESLECEDHVVFWNQELLKQLFSQFNHVINNAIDHGYVIPNRNLTEKPNIKLSMRAYMRGDEVVIEFRDHGAGLNLAKLKEIATERGLDLEDPSEVVFMDQVSSADAVTVSSGRGVGLSAVKSFVVEKGGTVAICNAPDGGGSQFVVVFPGELALVSPADAAEQVAS